MAEFQERRAPAGGFERVWLRLGRHEKIVFSIAFPLLLLAGIQFFALSLVRLVAGRRPEHIPAPLELLMLWGRANPAAVYGLPEYGAWHWFFVVAILVVLCAGVIVVAVITRKYRRDVQRKPGLAEVKDVAGQLGEKQLCDRAAHLRPRLAGREIAPTDVGYRVGVFRGMDLWLRVEDPTIIIGPSRAGKGWYLILNWLLSAPGAVVTTSVKMDNLKLTLLERERQGSRSLLFAPGITGGHDFGRELRWDPVAGCVDEETLLRRIHALIPEDAFSGSTSNGGHWDTLGKQLASHLFHAAACGGVGVSKIWEWVSSPRRAREAVELIRQHPQGLQAHAAHLESVLSQPADQLAMSWGVLPTVLSFLESGAARWWMEPAEDERVDLAEFVLQRGTLYLIGDNKAAGSYTQIIDGLLAEIDFVTKGLAMASPGNRLDPPITYLLDEAGNFEYQGMYEGITAGGGSGRVVVAVFQSKAQLAQFGGVDNAATLWDAAVAKIILPGGGDPKALDEISQLVGDTWVERESFTHDPDAFKTSTSFSAERREILTRSEIRELPAGTAIMFYRNLKPVIAKCTAFSENTRYADCSRDAAKLDDIQRAASPYKELLGVEHA